MPVPFLGAEATWEPTNADAEAAWELLVEIVTRISVVDLAEDEGSDREALTSLYSLFSTARGLLRTHGVATAQGPNDGRLSLAVVIVRLLNDVLRPFLARWHPRLQEHEAGRQDSVGVATWERQWGGPGGQLHHAFRSDLRQLRGDMREYIYVLGLAARASDFAGTVHDDQTTAGRAARRVYADAVVQGADDIGAVRSRMTRWFDPVQLVRTGFRMLFQTKDTRNSTAPNTTPPQPVRDHSSDDELWFDYIADMGDAYDPTAQIAWMAGREALTIGSSAAASERLPRGSFLILGGDEVYPYATTKRYAKQLMKPYKHALETTSGAAAPAVFAVPGNHDWYGGLAPWRDIFTAAPGSTSSFGGWAVEQTASWWTIKLPHGWWMWGLDTYTDGTINQAQRDHFARASKLLQQGDQVILCTPVPLWHLRENKPDQLVVIDELVREHIDAAGARARVFLAGDSHVFARYLRRPESNGTLEHHITSGGGGAFMHPTHNLASAVPQTAIDDGAVVDQAPFIGGRFWPDRHKSREGIVRGALHALRDRQSISLGALIGALHASYGLSAGAEVRGAAPGGGWRGLQDAFRSATVPTAGRVATAVAAVLLIAAGIGMARPNTKERAVVRFARRAGVVHGVLQLGIFVVAAALSHWIVGTLANGSWPPAVVPVTLGAVIGAAGTLVCQLVYLSTVNRNHRVNDNEAFSMRRYEDGKHFLRCHIDATGQLTIRLIAVDRIRHGWAAALTGGKPLPPAAPATSKVHLGAVEWTETVRPQIDPIPFVDDDNRWVAISVSDPDGASDEQITRLHNVVRAISESLLAAGCNLAYGGDDREGGYTQTLVEASERSADVWVPRVRRYLANAANPGAKIRGAVELIAPETGTASATTSQQLTSMRTRITETTIARIVIGGRARGRTLPGVVEEAALSFEHDQCLLVVGGFGGAAAAIANVLKGENPPTDMSAAGKRLLEKFRPASGSVMDDELLSTSELHRVVHLVVEGIRAAARRS
ncbi:MAG TPA: hypothetical protein VFB78_08290 [Acidimicrobiales bacterium]|nr:hypothetical protein [Acidimicrobiales bacterium]